MTVGRGPAAPGGSGTLAPVREVDHSAPAELAGRWRAADTDVLLCRDSARSLLKVGGLLLGMGCLLTALTGGAHDDSVAGFALLAGVMLLLAYNSHRRARNRPGGIAAAEINLVLAHRRQVTFHDWALLPQAGAPREVAAARRAADLAGRLLALPQWTTEVLAPHRIRLNPDAEAQLIQLSCRELYDLRIFVEMEIAAAGQQSTPTLLAIQRDWAGLLEASWASLHDRVECFAQLTADTVALAEAIRAAESVQRLSAVLVERESGMALRTAGHELAAAHLQRLRAEIAALQIAVTEVQVG